MLVRIQANQTKNVYFSLIVYFFTQSLGMKKKKIMDGFGENENFAIKSFWEVK